MNIDNLLRDIGISDTGEYVDNVYVITFADYDEFSDVYNILENAVNITKNSPESFLNEKESHVQYETEDYVIELIGLFDVDEYTLNIREREEITNE